MREFRCWQCDSFQAMPQRMYVRAKPARPARLFGLIPAREAQPARWVYWCVWCEAEWYAPVRPDKEGGKR